MASVQFPDAEWLSLDCVQSGHSDELMHPPSAHIDMWFARNSYIPVRQMYSHSLPNGKPRPVIDLEPHYEATHYHFDVSLDGDVSQLTITAQPPHVECRRHSSWRLAGSLLRVRTCPSSCRLTESSACGYTYGVNSIWQMYNAFSTTHGPNQGVSVGTCLVTHLTITDHLG